MPTYDYQCDACGHEFELFQQMSDAVKRKCPKCGKPRLKRLIGTGAGVIFKGGGFYETDYRSDSYKKDADADKKAAEPKSEKADSKTEAKSDSKSETKTESKSDSSSDAKSKSDSAESKSSGSSPTREGRGTPTRPAKRKATQSPKASSKTARKRK